MLCTCLLVPIKNILLCSSLLLMKGLFINQLIQVHSRRAKTNSSVCCLWNQQCVKYCHNTVIPFIQCDPYQQTWHISLNTVWRLSSFHSSSSHIIEKNIYFRKLMERLFFMHLNRGKFFPQPTICYLYDHL